MKASILIALLLTAGIAQAKTVCTINKGKDMTFDQSLYSAEANGPHYVLIKNGEKTAEASNFEQIFEKFSKSPQEWRKLAGSVLVTFSPQDGGMYGISVSRVDLKKTENILPIEAMTVGTVTEKQPLNLIVPGRNLSVICLNLPTQ